MIDDPGATLVRFKVAVPTPLAGADLAGLRLQQRQRGAAIAGRREQHHGRVRQGGSLSGNASVNQYSTAYSTTGMEMSIDKQVASTMMAGPPELMEQEAAYLAALPQTATYTIEGDELWLRDAEGAALAHYVAE